MSELRKANTDHAYFLTFTVVGWIDLFTRKECCDIIINSMKFCQQNKELEIYAYVIMPSHIHMIARRKNGLMSDLIRDIKSYTAKEIVRFVSEDSRESRKTGLATQWLLHMFRYHAKYQKQNKEFQIWQKSNHPIELHSNEVFDQKIEYIHLNPVTSCIVKEPECYVYSSANPESPLQTTQA
ncbi:MAG: transposase [Cyclobacteriaceae bacterium]